MSMQPTTIQSWDHFTSVVDKFIKNGPPTDFNYLFRGQSDASWDSLLPSIARSYQGLPAAEVHEAEKCALDMFRKQAHRFIDLHTVANKEDPLEWWPHMQHYLAPTRLLDWTASPYVAAYFATSDHREKDGVIWFVESDDLWNRMEKKYEMPGLLDEDNYIRLTKEQLYDPAAKPRIFVMYKTYDDARMYAQQGHYTFCLDPLRDQAKEIEAIANGPSDSDFFFGKYLISSGLKSEFMRKLYAMNIGANSLFPGMDGIGKSIAEILRLHVDDWPRRQRPTRFVSL